MSKTAGRSPEKNRRESDPPRGQRTFFSRHSLRQFASRQILAGINAFGVPSAFPLEAVFRFEIAVDGDGLTGRGEGLSPKPYTRGVSLDRLSA